MKPLQLHTLNSKQFRKFKDFIGKNSHQHVYFFEILQSEIDIKHLSY